ncbi:MAG: hypothetical protein Q7O04_03140 [Candidatus Omnitrophota bacterium]|nr:hypothetical protein [Candidatus Omnitrophota bacterium]
MEKIKKDLNLALVLLIMGILLSSNAYAVSKDCLRVPIGNYDRINRILYAKDNSARLKEKINSYLREATMLLNSNPDLELLEGRIHDLLTDAQGMRMSLEALEEGVARSGIFQRV